MASADGRNAGTNVTDESTDPRKVRLTAILCTVQLSEPPTTSDARSTTVPTKTASACQTAAHGGVRSQVQAAAMGTSGGAVRSSKANAAHSAVDRAAGSPTRLLMERGLTTFVSIRHRSCAIAMPTAKKDLKMHLQKRTTLEATILQFQ
jgi:hypothetical protein